MQEVLHGTAKAQHRVLCDKHSGLQPKATRRLPLKKFNRKTVGQGGASQRSRDDRLQFIQGNVSR
jgi:hypothetical protein